LTAGTYTVTVTDANGCIKTTTATVSQPTIVSLNTAVTNVLCNGASTGAIDLTVSGGTPGYTYVWSTSATTQDISNLSAGTYTVTVTDANGCSKTTSATVTQPSAIAISSIVTSVLCNGAATGVVDLTVSGGTPGYTYLWSNGATTQDISNLAAGTYTATVTDANACTKTTSATVTENSTLALSSISTPVSCFGGNNGAVDLTVTGGTAPYTYLWSNTATTQDIAGLTAGTYTVTVTDSYGCSKTTSATVQQPTALVLSTTVTNVSCYGGFNGTVDLSVAGGSPAYTYLWSNAATTQDLTNVFAGTYTVTVTDSHNCTKTTSVIITQPTDISPVFLVTHVICFGGNNGAIDLSVSGGTPGYTYSWSNGATTQDISNLTAGIYTVTATDANGCTKAVGIIVVQPPEITLSETHVNVACNGSSTGSIDLTATGGTGVLSYDWAHIAGNNNPQDPTGLAAGTYCVTVTDANACTKTLCVTITQTTPVLLSTVISDVSCFGGANGAIDLTVSGGVSPYTYNWSNSVTTQDIAGLVVGTYTVTVTDVNGCTKTTSATVNQPTALTLSGTVANTSCTGTSDGSIDLTVTGGTPGYTYDWSNDGPETPDNDTQDLTGVPAGTYTVTVTDANGCTATMSKTILQPSILVVTAVPTPCNPTNNLYDVAVQVSWTNAPTTAITVTTNQGGTATINIVAGSSGTQTVTITGLTSNGAQDVDVTAQFNANCLHTALDIYDAPLNCIPAEIGNYVWEDTDADGVQDGDENGIAGVTVTLNGTNQLGNVVTLSTTTNASGLYLFTNLVPGTYQVTFGTPVGGYFLSPQDQGGNDATDSDAAPGTQQTIPTILLPGESDLTWDAGFFKKAAIGDFVWNDTDGDGIQDAGEPGIPNILVTLTGTDGNGNPVNLTTTTNGSGGYLFPNLVPGTYKLTFASPGATWAVTPQDQGGNDATDSDIAPGTLMTVTTVLTSGETDLTWDAGFSQLAEIGNFVWNDLDLDGIQDGGEPGIAGVPVTLTGTTGTGAPVSLTTTTDGSGLYLFNNLMPGTYFVTFGTPVGGYLLTPQDQGGNDATDSDAAPGTQQTINTILTSGESDLTWDAGFYLPAPSINLEKYVNGQDADAAPGVIVIVPPGAPPTVTFTFTVTNSGNIPLSNVVVTDNIYGPVCTIPALAVGASQTCTITAPAQLGLHTNIATVSGQPVLPPGNTPFGPPVTDTDPGNYTGVFINMDKMANKTEVCAGELVTYTLITRMLGGAPGVEIRNISAVDNNMPGSFVCNGIYWVTCPQNGGQLCDLDGDCVLDFVDGNGNGSSDEEFKWTYTMPITQTTVNIANDMGEVWYVDPTTGVETFIGNVGNSDQVTVTVNPNLCAEIGNYVWEDTDADGIQDGSETGIQNVPVTLNGTNADGVVVTLNTTTDATGLYLFSGLVAGTYKVTFGTPAGGYTLSPQDQGGNDATDSDAAPGTQQTITTILTPGESDLTWDAGFYKSASIGDFVWNDTDGDGVQDAGEPGIPNILVTLTGTDGNGNPITLTTTTNGSGAYLFPNLVPGTYKLTFASPGATWAVTPQDQGGNDATDSDIAPGTLMTVTTVLTSGETDLTWDAGFYQLAEIGNYVWEDTDADGVQDGGEPGITGVLVTLTGTTGSGAPVSLTTTTNGTGFYLFSGLQPGTYHVTFGTPVGGYTLSPQDQGGNDATDSDAAPVTQQTINTILISGESDLTWDAGFYKSATIGDFVWNDTDGDGVQDAGEPGIPNILVTLTGTDGNGNPVTLTTTTNGSGAYLFPNLVPGTYKLTFASPGATWAVTPQDQGGNDATDSDIAPGTLMTVTTVLTSGETDLTWDAGFYQLAEIGNYVWEDTDADGVQDGGEPGIAGVLVTLTGTTGSGAPVSLTTTTNGTGFYLFSGLQPGTYNVTFGTPVGGYTLSPQDQGGNDATDSDAAPVTQQTINTILISGESDLTWDAGFYKSASIGDFVWNDTDGDGVQDAGEPGIPNILVTLTGTDGNGNPITLTTTTNGSGAYLFPNLVPGTYKLTFASPGATWAVTPQDQGGNDATDSDIAPGTLMTVTTVLTSGETDLTWDAGFYQLAEIGNYVWEDTDADGVQDGGEPGIAGVLVTLTGTTGSGAPVSLTTTTNGTGFYLFSGLQPGTYNVTFGTPVGGYTLSPQDQGGNDATDSDAAPVTQQTINTILVSGESDLTWDAGFYKSASIGDFVWNDTDGDGVQDAGEPGIPNILVTLTGTDGNGNAVTLTTTTNGSGAYLFPNLVPGTYKLTFASPGATWAVTPQDQGGNDATDSDIAPGTLMTVTTVLTSGETDLTWDAGFYQLAEIGNYVWEDTDADGVQDGGEPGIAGVLVTLTGTTGSGAPVSLTTTTNGTGFYLFSGLQPGTYNVTFGTPVGGYTLSPQDQGGNDATDSDAAPVTQQTINTILISGESDLTWDAGFYKSASIGDFVWNDTDGDGVQDAGEPGIPNILVTLTGTDGNGNPITLTTTTNGSGAYLFPNLVPGTYKLTFASPGATWAVTPQDQGGNDATDSDIAPGTLMTVTTVLTSGETDLTWDAGFYQLAEIGNYVWEDTDADGVQDGGEPGIAGVLVTLTGTTGSGAPVSLTTTTNGTGFYLFSGLQPGTYNVTFGTPVGGYTLSPQDQGGNDATDSDAAPVTQQTINTILISGESDLTWDAGFYKSATIGDFVWNDTDGDGVQDAGEPGIPNILVTLTGTDGNGNAVTLTTTTNGSGAYLFPNLVPGTYKLTFASPGATWAVTPQDQGGNDATDSDIAPGTLMTVTTVLTSGETDLTWDAGFYQPATIGNYVWQDNNANGIQEGTEPGIAGVTVTLTGTTGNGTPVTLTTTTNGSGLYTFTNLQPGTYVVTFSSPGAGFNLSPQNQGGNDDTDSDAAPGTLATIPTVLVSGEVDLTWDAGFYGNAEIGNFVWEDTDADGVQDAGEPGIPGVTVTLNGTDGAGNPVSLTTTTNGSGLYLFANLVPGTYNVTFGTPAGGYTLSPQDQGGNDATDSDAAPGTQQTVNTVLVAGESDLSWDAGFYKTATIGDYVWNDIDGDGVQDGNEPGIPNILVTLTGTTGNGTPVTLTTTTNGAGGYLFPNLQPGTYKLTFASPGATWAVTPQDQGGNDATDSDIAPGTLMTVTTVLTSGETDLTWDAGFYQLAEIGNYVWEDTDADGVQDGGEPGIAGVLVTLERYCR
jgi:hypothetical protein